jgi:hypothetical protein
VEEQATDQLPEEAPVPELTQVDDFVTVIKRVASDLESKEKSAVTHQEAGGYPDVAATLARAGARASGFSDDDLTVRSNKKSVTVAINLKS